MSVIRGIFPIVYSPFTEDGHLVEEDLSRLVDYLVKQGAHGLAAVGGASECHKLTISERKRLAELTVAAAGHRVPVLVGTSTTNTGEAVELTRHATSIGAVGVFCTPPLFGVATSESLRAHFGALARSTELPVLIQDAEVVVPTSVIAGLGADYPNLRWVKEEAVDSGHRIGELRRACSAGVTIMSGGGYLLDDLARGVVGAIPGSIGVADLARAYELFVAGDETGARLAFNHFLPLSYWRRQFPLLGAKEVLRRLGVFRGAHLRLPNSEYLDDQDHRELSTIMEVMGAPY